MSDFTSLEIDRSKYDNGVLNTCEILATYFVNFYYNEAYCKMNDIKMNKGVDSLTDAYRNYIQSYFSNLYKPEYYKRVIEGIVNLYTKATGVSILSFRECIHRIGQQFAAKDSYDGFNDSQRQGLVRKVIMDVNKMFIDHIFRKRLHIIIDHHKEKANAETLKQEFIDMLLFEREKLLNEYYSVVIGGKSQGMMTLEVGELLKQKLALAIKEKIIAVKKGEQWQKIAEEYKLKYEDLLQKSIVSNQKNARKTSIESEPVESESVESDIIESEENESNNIEASPVKSQTKSPVLSIGSKSPLLLSPSSNRMPISIGSKTEKLIDSNIDFQPDTIVSAKEDDNNEIESENMYEDVSESEESSEFMEDLPKKEEVSPKKEEVKVKKDESKSKKKSMEDFDQFDDFLDEKPTKVEKVKEEKHREEKVEKKKSKKLNDDDSIFDDFKESKKSKDEDDFFDEKPKKDKSKKDKKNKFDDFSDEEIVEKPKKEKKSKEDDDIPEKSKKAKDTKESKKDKKPTTAVAPTFKSRGITLKK